MPTPIQTPDAPSTPTPHTGAISRVLALLERPVPWPETLIEQARDAVLEVAARLGRLDGLAGARGGVEMSPDLARAVEAVRAAVVAGATEAGS